jgi:hypothetical protein
MQNWLTLGTPRAALTLLYNFVPVLGVILWGWDALALIFLYWIENVLTGMRTIAGLIARAVLAEPAALFFAAFFTLHYGMFCFVHGLFLVSLFAPAFLADNPFDPFVVTRDQMRANPNFAAAVGAAAGWQVVEFVYAARRGELTAGALQAMMLAPYPRIMVLHITIIAFGAVLAAAGAPQAGVVLLALFKTVADVGFVSWGERRDRAGAP